MIDISPILGIRDSFKPSIRRNEEIFKSMFDRIAKLHKIVGDRVAGFAETDHVAYKVGDKLSSNISPVRKLQQVRQSIYVTAEIVSDFRVTKFPLAYAIQADAKSLYTALNTEWLGDEILLKNLKTHSDKIREVEYMLSPITVLKDKIQTMYTTLRGQVDWMSENLDQLNKIESALRLEHNMKLTLNAIGDNSDDDFDGEDGIDLTEVDLGRKPTSSPQGNTVSMEPEHDPLDDL